MSDVVSRRMTADRARFFRMLGRLDTVRPIERRAQLCAQAALFAVRHPCGLMYSDEIERELQAIADTLPMPAPRPARDGHFLHVFTRAYPSGGHTRVCERWIAASPAAQTHDVVLISQGQRPVPNRLAAAAASRQGTIHRLPDGFPLEKAVALRDLAQDYQAVILHVHGYDTVPMLALAYQAFTRPVIFYNHADHLFWLGATLADLVINYRSETVPLDRLARGVQNHAILPLPIDEPRRDGDDAAAIRALRRRLGYGENDRLIISVASAYKFVPFAGLDYLRTARSILAQAPDASILVIGPDRRDQPWRDAWRATGGRINAIGTVLIDELDGYIRIADLALESFPLGSPTALMEVARYGVPCLGMKTPVNRFDLFDQAGIACDTEGQLIERALRDLAQPPRDKPLLDLMKRHCFPAAFAAALNDLYERLPKTHIRRRPEPRAARDITAFERFIAENTLVQERRWRVRLENIVRRLADLYACRLYPLGLSRRLYAKLNSYGLL